MEDALFGEKLTEDVSARLNCIVDTAMQGDEGLEKIRQAKLTEPYDVVFVDMRMPPGWDGLQTMKEIWRIVPDQFVVLCTAYSDHSFDDIVRELGMKSNFLILHKPFAPDEVQQIVQSVVARTSNQVRTDRKLASQLERAIVNEELSLAFQPILNLATGEIWAFEALCRWERDGKPVSRPDEFIRVAEDSGLICDLGNWVLREAMACSKELESATNETIRISVNVSPLQLKPGFDDALAYMLIVNGIQASSIGLEITESRILETGSESETVIANLRDLGFHILLDDFGSGYSNLLGLASKVFETLKVDRLFCAGLHSSSCTIPIVKSVIDVAIGLGKNCIVEGVETKHQEDTLRRLGCNLVQGYLYSPPIALDEAIEWFRNRNKSQSRFAA